jgi:tartrate-resistant acid phosphatase type 5
MVVTASSSVPSAALMTFGTAAADLIIDTVSAPSHGSPGAVFDATDVIRNAGTADSRSSVTRYYFSRDAIKSSGDVRSTGSRSISTLIVGSQSQGVAKLAAPSTLAPGTYTLFACADDTRLVAEDNEANNCTAAASLVTVSLADLVDSAVSNPPSSAAPGTSFSVTDTVHNPSSLAVAASVSRFYLSNDNARNPGDVLLTGARNVVGLASGSSSTGSRSVTIPASLSEGTYRLLACADDLAKVPETNEANNCAASASSVVIGWPDLRVTRVSKPPAALRPGRAFSVTDTVHNGGTAPSVASIARYYLSANATKDSSDVPLSPTRSISILAPGAASTGSKTVTIPTTSPLGPFYLLACADDRLAVRESNETNNCTASGTTIQIALPDLAMSAVSNPPNYTWPGKVFPITTTVVNQGASGAPVSTTRHYLSANASKDAGDIVLAETRVIGELTPAQTSLGTTTVSIPTDTVFANYTLLACANDLGTFTETSTTNNCAASQTFTVGRFNVRPRAHAGFDQDTVVGSVIQLDARGSTDADGDDLTYVWTLLARPAASNSSLSDPVHPTPTLVLDLPGQYVLQLIVHDGMEPSEFDVVTITTGAVRLAALGDTGTGDAGQYQGAAALNTKCARSGCAFAVLLGDNIYSSGVSSVTDEQFNTKFELPYAQIDLPFYAVLGNHDYGGGGAGTQFYKGQFQVDYSTVSAKWRMPAAYYRLAVGDVEFFGLDTNMQLYGQDQQQRADIAEWLQQSTASWRIAFGHHPYRSNGSHGNAGAYNRQDGVPDGALVKSFMDDIVCGRADLLLSGHDHNLQWLQPDGTCAGTELIVSGAGAYPKALRSPTTEGYNATYFQAAKLGFVYLVVSTDQLTAQFVGENGEVLYVRTLTKAP